jgi:hypothetical protein
VRDRAPRFADIGVEVRPASVCPKKIRRGKDSCCDLTLEISVGSSGGMGPQVEGTLHPNAN